MLLSSAVRTRVRLPPRPPAVVGAQDVVLREPGPFRGHVVDYLMLPHWPVFNVADICINVAAGLILLQAIRGIGIDGTRAAARGQEA